LFFIQNSGTRRSHHIFNARLQALVQLPQECSAGSAFGLAARSPGALGTESRSLRLFTFGTRLTVARATWSAPKSVLALLCVARPWHLSLRDRASGAFAKDGVRLPRHPELGLERPSNVIRCSQRGECSPFERRASNRVLAARATRDRVRPDRRWHTSKRLTYAKVIRVAEARLHVDTQDAHRLSPQSGA
jgi:hypothetical protein